MGLLDIYLASQEQLTTLDSDLVTQYPSTNTGLPTAFANPGPVIPFNQEYSATQTYLAYIQAATIQQFDQLTNSLNKTNLDVENPGVAGGPNADITTQYPPLVTGTPTNTQNPGGPVTNFSQPYLPSSTYLDTNPIQGVDSQLAVSVDVTNLDVENPGPSGGPNTDITTQYPPLATGTPTPTQNPGGPLTNFSQPYLPSSTYLDTNPIQGLNSGQLSNTLEITNLDVENPGVQGGPNADITTQYPSLVTGTPTPTQNPGGPLTNFSQPYLPSNTYLESNPIQGEESGQLSNTLEITNLDVEDPGVQGGPNADITTNYPATNTGTPTAEANPGPLNRFNQPYLPSNTYLNYIQNAIIEVDDPLFNSLNKTNLDVENPDIIGGPNVDTTTQYPPLVTGTPTTTQNPGGPPVNFNQPYTPSITYLDTNPIQGATSGELSSSLGITNLDVENPGVQGGIPYRPLTDPTVYPITTTGGESIRGYFPTSSRPAQKYGVNSPTEDPVPFSAQNTYSDFIKNYI